MRVENLKSLVGSSGWMLMEEWLEEQKASAVAAITTIDNDRSMYQLQGKLQMIALLSSLRSRLLESRNQQ